jgi:hypothetical protein
MKKIVGIFILLGILISGCEKDDFCTQNPVTPMLILRFYDDANRETLKSAQRLSIWAEGKDTISDYKSVSIDSIAIPLNSLTTETVYHLKINTVDGNIANNITETFTIQYTPVEEFVSRSCGFRVIFNDATFTPNNTWIQEITPETLTTIDNQSAAHVKIYH